MAGTAAGAHRRAATSLKTRLSLLLGGLALVVVGVAFETGRAVREHTATTSEIDQLLVPAQRDLDRLLAALVDQETGMRGFIITQDARFLEPYDAGRTAADEHLEGLNRRFAADARVAELLDRARSEVREWRAAVVDPQLAAVRAGDPDAAAALVATGRGKQRFDRIRATIGELDGVLSERLAAARVQLRSVEAREARAMLTALAIAVLMILGLALLLLRSVIRPLDRLGANVRRVTDGDLEHRVPADGPTEIALLGDGVEAMRGRVVAEVQRVREANDSVAAANDELTRSNAELVEFAYVASHDLSEPLRVISGFTQLLEADYRGRLDADADEYLDHIVDGVARMRSLLDGLLEMSRVGRAELTMAPVDLNDVLVDVRHDLGASLADAGAELVVRDLPTVDGDRRQLHQLFQNLVANAVKYREPSRPPEIEVLAQPVGGGWRVVVADNGIGIDPKYHERVFGMFKRLHGRDEFAGSGIGLALCRKIAERHRATITIEENQPHGTCFVVGFEAP